MAKVSPQITSFTAGELSPRLEGRTDLEKYNSGCRKLENFLVHPHGGAARRPGTEFIGQTISNKKTRVIPFEYSADDTFGLVLEPNFFWVTKNGAVIQRDAEGKPDFKDTEIFDGPDVYQQQMRDFGAIANDDGQFGEVQWNFNSTTWQFSRDGTHCYSFYIADQNERVWGDTPSGSDRWVNVNWYRDFFYAVTWKCSEPYSFVGLEPIALQQDQSYFLSTTGSDYDFSDDIQNVSYRDSSFHVTPDDKVLVRCHNATPAGAVFGVIMICPFDEEYKVQQTYSSSLAFYDFYPASWNLRDFCVSREANTTEKRIVILREDASKIQCWFADTNTNEDFELFPNFLNPNALDSEINYSSLWNTSEYTANSISINDDGTKIFIGLGNLTTATPSDSPLLITVTMTTPYDLTTATTTFSDTDSTTFVRFAQRGSQLSSSGIFEAMPSGSSIQSKVYMESDGKTMHSTVQSLRVGATYSKPNSGQILQYGPWKKTSKDSYATNNDRIEPVNAMKIHHPFGEDELSGVRFAQSADVMYMVQQNNHPIKVVRYFDDDWRVEIPKFNRGPLLDPLGYADDGVTLMSATVEEDDGGYVTITASHPIFSWYDVGRLFKTNNMYFEIAVPLSITFLDFSAFSTTCQAKLIDTPEDEHGTFLTSASGQGTVTLREGDPSNTGLEHNDRATFKVTDEVNLISMGFREGRRVDIFETAGGAKRVDNGLLAQVTRDTMVFAPSVDLPPSGTTPTVYNSGRVVQKVYDDYASAFGAFSARTGYPSAVALFEQRLVLAGTEEAPQTIFFSKAGDLEGFELGTDATDSLTYTIGSQTVDTIQYIQTARTLILGTSGGEFSVSASSAGPINPTNTQIVKQASYGSSTTQPVTAGNITLFVQRSGRKIRELVYDFNSDSYYAPDLTLLAEHITDGGIVECAYQQEPDNIVWIVLNTGELLGMTYRREENVIAWHRHKLGGSFGADEFGHVESVCSLKTSTDEEDVLVVVKRTIDGETKRFVERLGRINPDLGEETPYFVDAGISYSGPATNSLSGLLHLKGETVTILADGAVHADKVVSSTGTITLDREATDVRVGLSYKSILETMRLDYGGEEGTSQAKNMRVREITLRLYEAGFGLKVGATDAEVQEIYFRETNDSMDETVPLFTGDKTIEFSGGFSTNSRIYIEQDKPVSTTILSIYPLLQTWDR